MYSGRLVVILLVIGTLLGGCAGKRSLASAPVALQKGKAVVSTARSSIGTPYKWGGESPEQGFDCSGLVWWVYLRNGIHLPRVSGEQVLVGERVDEGSLMPGDLVVFRMSKWSGNLHLGIYSGEGTFIHSPKSGGKVREESTRKPYWVSRFKCGRRVFE